MKPTVIFAAAVAAALLAAPQTRAADLLPGEGEYYPPPPPRYSAPAPRYYEYEQRVEPAYRPHYEYDYRSEYRPYSRYEEPYVGPPRPPADIAGLPPEDYYAGPRYSEHRPRYAEPCYWNRGEPYWDGYRWTRPRVRACE